jgi:hypothetical protein
LCTWSCSTSTGCLPKHENHKDARFSSIASVLSVDNMSYCRRGSFRWIFCIFASVLDSFSSHIWRALDQSSLQSTGDCFLDSLDLWYIVSHQKYIL